MELQQVVEIGKRIPPWDPLMTDEYPSYRYLRDDPVALGTSNPPPEAEELVTPFTGKAVLQKDYALLRAWLLSFGLFRLSPLIGAYYIAQAYHAGCSYPPEIIKLIERFIVGLPQKPDLFASHIWYRPGVNLDTILEGIYWYRSLRPNPPSLIKAITTVDLYLFASNPYTRIPIQTLISYMTDYEIFSQLGQVGNELLPKESTRLERLLTVVNMTLNRFGYIRILNFNYPARIQFVFNQRSQDIPLDYLLKDQITLGNLVINPIVLFRLYLQLEGCRGWVDLTEFEAFLHKKDLDYYRKVYTLLTRSPIAPGLRPQPIPPSKINPERFIFPCLVCGNSAPEEDFSWCGHGVCKYCQTGPQCPFCNEHFVCDSLSDSDIKPPKVSPDLKIRIARAKSIAEACPVSFDFINHRLRYPW